MRGFFVFWDWGHIHCCGEGYLGFRPYGGSLFPNAEKVTKKALPRRTARSLGLGVPSLRDRSGRSGSGWLRCTYTRCVRLRRTVAALPPPDRSRNEACRRGKRSRARAKARSKDRSLRQLLQLDWIHPQKQAVWQAAFASRLTPTEKQNSAAARGEAAPLNNERKLECF
jgi:hypothetical protein